MSEKEFCFPKKVRSQYNIFMNCMKLPLTNEVKRALLPQSVIGTIHEGHGLFTEYPYPNMTQQEVFEALGFDPAEYRIFRENLILDFIQCIDDLFCKRKNKLTNRKGEPLFGANFLEDIVLEADKDFFKGGVLAGGMDIAYWREKTKENFAKTLKGRNLELGYGDDFIIDLDAMKNEGLTFLDLSKKAHSKEDIKNLIEKKIISSNGSNESAYIRFVKGLGCCDDACLTTIGRMCGRDGMLLGWGVDASDTYTKFVANPKKGGFDRFIKTHIERLWRNKYKEELVTPEEQMTVIYLGAKNNDPVIPMSSSHRRLCQQEKRQKNPTIINHCKFVEDGKIPSTHHLGFQRISSDKFYNSINERLKLFNEKYSGYLPYEL